MATRDIEEQTLLKQNVPSLQLTPRASVYGTGFNMFKNMCGAGILGLPFAVSELGLAGFGFMTYSACLSLLSLYFIMACIDICKRKGIEQPYSYKAIAVAAFGDGAGKTIDCIIMCYTMGTLVAFGVLIVDFIRPPLQFFLGDGVWTESSFILSCATIIIFALCCLPSMDALKYTSLLGNGILAYTVVLIIYEWYNRGMGVSEDIVLAKPFAPRSLKVLGIFTSAFNFHYNMPIYYNGRQPSSPVQMLPLLFVVFAGVIAFYLSTAAFAYFTFGNELESNILKNFGSDTRFLICRMGLGFMIICTYPIVATSTKSAIARMISGDVPLSYEMNVKISAVIVPFCLALSAIVPNFGVVLSYNGAIFGTLMQLVFPALAFCVLSKRMGVTGIMPTLGYVVGVLGFAAMFIGAGSQTYCLSTGACNPKPVLKPPTTALWGAATELAVAL